MKSALALLRRREASLILFGIVLVALIAIRAPRFLDPKNLQYVLDDTSILIMVSLGQLLVILIGGIDLSVASGIGLAGMITALINKADPGIPMIGIVAIALGVGFILGSFNGFLVSVAKIPAIITTLGTLSIYRGVVFLFSGGAWVSADEMSAAYRNFTHFSILGFTTLMMAALVVFIIVAVFLRFTRTGRELYGVGGNLTAAQYVGINLRKANFLPFLVSGIIVGLAGLLWVSRYASAQNDSATGFELQTVAACVIGGVSIAGGTGTAFGVLLGAILLGIIKNALTLIDVSPFWQMAIQGFVILVAIVTNTLVDRRNERRALERRRLA